MYVEIHELDLREEYYKDTEAVKPCNLLMAQDLKIVHLYYIQIYLDG